MVVTADSHVQDTSRAIELSWYDRTWYDHDRTGMIVQHSKHVCVEYPHPRCAFTLINSTVPIYADLVLFGTPLVTAISRHY